MRGRAAVTLYKDKVLSQWMGVTPRRVRQLREEGIIEEARPGLYELQPNIVRYISYLRNGAGHGALNDERAMLTKAKREMAQMENDERRGILHRTDEIEKGLNRMVLNFRNRALAIPAKEAPKLVTMGADQGKIFDELTIAVRELLNELQNFNVAFAMEDGEEDDEEAPM